jgi:hypothetical protein
MKPCIYGPESHPEGTVICVNGRGLQCVVGEWRETDQACDGDDGEVLHRVDTESPALPVQGLTKARQ